MAKIVGLVGAVSGKVGNFVGAVVGGVQTMRVYQPIVANPRTVGQMLQRGKVNLAGQLTSVISRVAIEGLPGNARKRRSELNRTLINAVAEASNVYSVKGERIVLSKGNAVFQLSTDLGELSVGDSGQIQAEIGLIAPYDVAQLAGKTVRVVMLAVPKPIVTGQASPAMSVTDFSLASGARYFNTEVYVAGDAVNYNVFVYAIPMVLRDSRLLDYGYISSLEATGVVQLTGTMRTTGAYDFANSIYAGVKSVTTQP